MPLDWSPLVDLVRRRQRFLLTTHVRPDGDGIGSMLALADTLERQGKSVQMVIASSFPPRYDFMDPATLIRRFEPPGSAHLACEAALVLDTGTWNQLGDFAAFLKDFTGPRLVIDHHRTQDDLGATRLVDTSAEATGRLIHEAITALGEPLSEFAAHNLFIALAMDTRWLPPNNTSRPTTRAPAAPALAADPDRAGARPPEAYELLFEEYTLGKLRLAGLVLQRLQVTPDGLVAYTDIRRGDYETTGAVPQDSEDLVNY